LSVIIERRKTMETRSGLVVYYTGVGSRATPDDVLHLMIEIGEALSSENDYVLRSGGAPGADQAFERGGDSINQEIYIPWSGFEDYDEMEEHVINVQTLPNYTQAEATVAELHPNWAACSRGAKALHTRNVYEVLGWGLDRPSDLLIYWAPVDKSGKVTGGTATAVHLAQENNVPTYNLNDPLVREEWESALTSTAGADEVVAPFLDAE
jgi:hypothetical protein